VREVFFGIVRRVRPFRADRLEAAATRAIEIGTLTYGSVRSILDNKLDHQAAQRPPANGVPILHPASRRPSRDAAHHGSSLTGGGFEPSVESFRGRHRGAQAAR
jgi:hypothetical protein